MSSKTVYVCDLCKEETSEFSSIDFDFGDGCAFKGDACAECTRHLRSAMRNASRYSGHENWPTFYEQRHDILKGGAQ